MYVTGVNMASQVEDNKLDCKVCELSVKDENARRFIEEYTTIFQDSGKSFAIKAAALIEAWEKMRKICKTMHLDEIIILMNWAKPHTLHIVLCGDWKKFKDQFEKQLIESVEKFDKEYRPIKPSIEVHCRLLTNVVRDPWGNPTLARLLNTQDPVITQTEFDFFNGESGCLISMRIKKLCDSRCEDLALNLITAYMRCCDWAVARKLCLNLTKEQERYLLDMHITLLYKYKMNSVIITKLKTLSLNEGLQLIGRFINKEVSVSKIWRYSNKITHLAAVLFASSALMQSYSDTAAVLTSLVEVWLGLSDKGESLDEFVAPIRRVMQVATTACHMYIFCEAVFNKFGPKMKTFNIELYIQALTTDLNFLEKHKTENNKEEQEATSKRLAHGFLRLADVLDEHVNVCRECVLTSFSLKPTKECLQRIESIARRCGFEVLDTGQWKCKIHPPVQSTDDLCVVCTECGDFMSQMQLEAAINTNVALNEALTTERLGLSIELCDDLAVVLCSPRYHLLSWLQKWPELHRLCIMYLNDSERTKNLVTELKFVDIDYSQYIKVKEEPVEITEEYSVETGMESITELDPAWDPLDDEPKKEKKKPSRKKNQSSDKSPLYVPPKANSDPEVLKSLRSFRRSLKRPRNEEFAESISPSKVLASDPRYAALQHSSLVQNILQTPVLNSSKNLYTQNVNSSANVGYSQSNHFNNYNYNYYNRELGNSNNSYNYGCNSSQNGSVNNVNYKSGKVQPSSILKSSSTMVRENCTATSGVLANSNGLTSTPYYHYENGFNRSNNSQNEWSQEVTNKYKLMKSNQMQLYGERSNLAEKIQVREMAKSCDQGNSFLDYSSDKSSSSIKTERNNAIINDPPFQHDEKIRWSDEKVPPWEENRDPNIHEEDVEDFSDISSRYIGSDEDDWRDFAKVSNLYPYAYSKDKKSDGDQKNSYDTCSREKLMKDEEQNVSCVLDSETSTAKTASPTHLSSKPDESRLDDNMCHIKDCNALTICTDDKDVTKNYDDPYEHLDFILQAAEPKSEPEPKPEASKTKTVIEDLKEKFQLKELRVVLKRCNINALISKLERKKSEYKASFKKKKAKWKKMNKRYHKRCENKSNVQSLTFIKDEYTTRSFPLQDMNPRVVAETLSKMHYKKDKDHFDKLNNNNDDKIENNGKKKYNKYGFEDKILKVKLERLDVEAILANIPGMRDTELIRPSNVNNIVQVVQIAGGRPNPTAPNNQTSTQVSPHIQRIGQPRIDKPDPPTSETNPTATNAKSSTTPATSKPPTSQPSTLINILSQQIIRPGQSNARPRTGQFVNILSQQIVRPAVTAIANVKTTDSTSSITRTSTGEPQVLNQLINPVRTNATAVKTVVSNQGSDQSRIVQLICKSADGKLIPVTSFTPNRVVKVATTQTVTSSSPSSPTFDDSLTKLVQVSPKAKCELENAETLPKFQQAFGKTVYQNSVDSTSTSMASTIVNNVAVTEQEKLKTQAKTSTVNVQPLPGGVIYTRQVPVGQTINLIPNNRGQVFRIATSNSEQISLVKDNSVIHNKMSALLAAALQGKQKNSEVIEVESSAENPPTTQVNTRVSLTRPLVHNARIVKPVLQIPAGNVVRNSPSTPNLSSTTLEQLREFDMVYKQVKERSSTSTPSDTSTTTEPNESSQRISYVTLNQSPKINCSPVVVVSTYNSLQPAASPALSGASQGSSSPCVTPAPTPAPVLPKVAAKTSKGKSVKTTTMHTSKASPVPKPQQKPQEDEHTTQRIFDILAEYAEQLRNSPDLNNKPAPRRRSNPPTNPNQNSKRKKSSSSKKSGHCSSTLTSDADLEDHRTVGSEDSSCGVVQVSMQEDETNTPPAVNTSESNDSTVQPRQLILTESSTNQTRNLIIADSSVGEALKMPNTAVLVPGNYIMPVSMVKGGQQIAVVSGGSKILATVPARSGPNMLLFQSFLNQNRKTAVPTVKYSTIQPISGIPTQTITGVNTQQPVILQQSASHGISAVALSQQLPLKKMDEPDRLNTELLLTISQSRDNENSPSDEIPQPDSSTSVVSTNMESIDLEENATLSDTSSEKAFTYQKQVTTPIATPVIAQTTSKDDISISPNKVAGNGKSEERVQSVLVSAGTSNGPMLSHSPPHYTKQNDANATDQNKDEFLRNGGKRTNATETKTFQSNNLYTIHGKIKKANTQKIDRELQQLCLQRKQAALERELRLQKSLSEECEDLGVDEPSTSDLFPEADLLFDSNHSPSFDQSSQDIVKRSLHCQENKEESKLTLFCDDDFLFEPGEYQTAETELEYEEQPRLLTNGQSSTSTESSSPSGDHTLLQTCTSMSDVTLNSPISPDTFNASTPPPLNKYIHKYSNKKKEKVPKPIEHWPADVSSSEDTMGSTELGKSRSPDLCVNKRSDEELSDGGGGYKVVRVAISKPECDEMHCSEDLDCSMSGRGARRSVKKMCSCCNGSQDGSAASRKRPATSHPHTPPSHKKAFLNKKR